MDIITETLRWVNAEREARGIGPALDRLPKGQARDCYRCPVALALGDGTNVEAVPVRNGIYFVDTDVYLDPPDAVITFMDAFDNGELPEYVA